jgi:hypothetical protein
VIESYTVLIDDSVNSTSSQEGCTTMKVKRKNGILLAEEYVSDSDCSDVLPIYVRCLFNIHFASFKKSQKNTLFVIYLGF